MTDFSKIKTLYGITYPKGFSAEEIQSVRSIFGRLPEVLADYYAELGAEESLNQTQDSLNRSADFQSFMNDDYLIFYCENQRACVWGISREDLYLPNPPVYMSWDEKRWELESENLYDFLLAMAYLQAIFALEFGPGTFREISGRDLDFIRRNFVNKNVAFKQWAQGIEFYSNYDDSIIAVMGDGGQMIYSSRNHDHFIEMHAVLSGLGVEM